MSEELLLSNQYGAIKQNHINKQIPLIQFEHIAGEGVISLFGGQVLSWQPKDEREVFWKSNKSFYDNEHAIRGGVPICWPWFGADVMQSDGQILKASNHGFARDNMWQLADCHIGASVVIITLTFSGENYSSLWPNKFHLTQILTFSTEFTQTLTINNTSNSTMTFTGALHSYFSVSHPRNINISALSEVSFEDKISGEKACLDQLTDYYGPIDRIYHTDKTLTISDDNWQREIIVSSENCRQWVLWNPGDMANDMKDMHTNAANEFICLEAANTQWQSIVSQGQAIMKQTININKK